MKEQDLLVIEDNTIYEIDMHCMKCRTGDCHKEEKKRSKYEKKAYDQWMNYQLSENNRKDKK